MNVYFVRHGETELNVAKVTQSPTSQLSDLGRRQAAMVADRFLHTPIDHIIVSPYDRTKHTAEIIHQRIPHVPLTYSDLFVEQKRPTSVHGKSHTDSIVHETVALWIEHAHDPNWRYEDEENFHDLKQRAEKALAYLESLEYNNVLVVTHGMFLKALMSYMLFRDELTIKELVAVRRVFYPSNTGVTVCKYDKERNHWDLVTWNDLAHLAE